MSLESEQTGLCQTPASISDDQNRYQIRAMAVSDFDAVMEIEQQTWPSRSWGLNAFIDSCNHPRHCCWILEDTMGTHRVIGYGIQYAASNGEAHLTTIALRASERGRGLGGVLLRHMIRHARRIYASGVALQVSTSNECAYKLYAAHGFQVVGRLVGYYSTNEDAYAMRLVL